MALLLGLLLALVVAAALLIGGQPSPQTPAVSNGWVAFAASRSDAPVDGAGEYRDIYLTGEGTTARRIIGSDGDGRSQGCPRFSPDGSRLAYGEGDETEGGADGRGRWPITNCAVVVVELGADGVPSAETLRVSFSTDLGPLPCPEWSPTGSHLAAFTGTELWVADAVSGDATTFPVGAEPSDVPGFASLDLEWSPDGSSIAVTEAGRIRVIPVDGTEPSVFPVAYARSLGWITAGRQLVYITTDDAISSYDLVRVIDLDTGVDEVLRDDATNDGTGSVVASPDGKRVVYRRYLGGHPVVMDADGSNELVLPADVSSSGFLWSPDGQRVLWVLASVAVGPPTPSQDLAPPDLSLEWVDIQHVSWQAVGR